MRHHDNQRKFSRETNARHALIRSLAANLLIHGKMKTTEAKAKEIRPFVEKLVTYAKVDSVARRRTVISRLATIAEKPVKKLFTEYGPKFKARAGGYTRITKIAARKSDAAPMAVIEFVD